MRLHVGYLWVSLLVGELTFFNKMVQDRSLPKPKELSFQNFGFLNLN